MRTHYRVQLYWPGRTATPTQLAEQFWQWATALGQVAPQLAQLRPYTRQSELLQPLTGPQHAEALLTHWEVRWRTGDTQRVSYKPGLVLDRLDDTMVECNLVTGIEPLGMDPLWVPNRAEVLIRADAGDELVRPDVLLGILHAGVRVFSPDWGFASLDGDPIPPTPPFSQGTPIAAWITYLSRAYPVDRLMVREPSAAYSVGELGALVLAHPELCVPDGPRQREAVQGVADAFRAAGVTPSVPPPAAP